MTTYGFSAFLKLVNSSSKRQRSLIKQRLAPSRNGYDFHKAMRSICNGYLMKGRSIDESLTRIQAIVKEPEQKSALVAFRKLVHWRASNRGELFVVPERTFESPAGTFKVRFTADFGIVLSGQRLGIHLWNTKSPALDSRLTRAALALFPPLYDDLYVDDFAVLSLRTSQLTRLEGSKEAAVVAENIVAALEEVFIDIRSPLSTEERLEDRPGAK